MKRTTAKLTAASVMCVGLLTAGAAAFAQDTRAQQDYSATRSSPSKHQMMKDCMAREQAGDSRMSESEARKACHEALKDEKVNRDDERANRDNEPRDDTRPREPQ